MAKQTIIAWTVPRSGSVADVDLDAAGKAIMQAMKKNNPKAVWVAQAWQANPRPQMIGNLEAGD